VKAYWIKGGNVGKKDPFRELAMYQL